MFPDWAAKRCVCRHLCIEDQAQVKLCCILYLPLFIVIIARIYYVLLRAASGTAHLPSYRPSLGLTRRAAASEMHAMMTMNNKMFALQVAWVAIVLTRDAPTLIIPYRILLMPSTQLYRARGCGERATLVVVFISTVAVINANIQIVVKLSSNHIIP